MTTQQALTCGLGEEDHLPRPQSFPWHGLGMSLFAHLVLLVGLIPWLSALTAINLEDAPIIEVEFLEPEAPAPQAEEVKEKPKEVPPPVKMPPRIVPQLAPKAESAKEEPAVPAQEAPPPVPSASEPAAAQGPVIAALPSERTLPIPFLSLDQLRQSYGVLLWQRILLFKPTNLRAEGKVVVSFSLKPDGRLTALAVTTSSGNEVLDQAALESVRLAQPYPPPPPELAKEGLSFSIPFQFKRRPS